MMRGRGAAGGDPFLIRAQVSDFDAWVARYRSESAAALADPGLDWLPPLRTGPDPAQEVLVARPRGPAPPGGWPLHLFVHGGYWRAFAPRDYAFLARAICGLGAVAVLPGYRKMPRHRLGDLVEDVRAAQRAALASAAGWGADPARLTASGHSAGAHLACYIDPPPRRLLLVSGVFDPALLRESAMQAEIGLKEQDLAWTPLELPPPRAEVALLVGARETAPFHDQARALALRWGTGVAAMQGEDHMSVVHALGVPGTAAHAALARTIGEGRGDASPRTPAG